MGAQGCTGLPGQCRGPAISLTSSHPRVQAWLEIREALEMQLEPLGRAAMSTLNLQPGDRVLDLGCGIGRTPRALAEAVGAGGQVLGLDILDEAIRIAGQDFSATDPVSFQIGDAQTFPFVPASLDAVFSRFGTQTFADPVAGLRNLNHALRPGGRLGFVCWRGLDENELDHLPLRAVAAHLPPDRLAQTAQASWFSLSDPVTLRQILRDAGFVEVEIQAHDALVTSGSLEEMIAVCLRVGALGAILRDHPELRPLVLPDLREALSPRDGPGGPGLLAATWVVSARTQT